MDRPAFVARLALVAFVLAWLFGPDAVRDAIPIWLPFVVALALEVGFFVGGLRSRPWRPEPRGRAPQLADVERYGYEGDELLLVRRGGEELWVPWSGEEGEELEELIERTRERGEPAPVDDDGGGVRGFALALAGIAALAVLAWAVESRSGWSGLDDERQAEAEALLSREARRIAGHRVEIRCDDAGERVGAVQHRDGVAQVGGRIAWITPDLCHRLYLLAFEGEYDFTPTAKAIAVLAHEAWHLQGVRNESVTQCYALQSGVAVGRRLGLTERTAREMMRQQFAENAVLGRTRPEYLVGDDCRDGGRLDLRPDDPRFP